MTADQNIMKLYEAFKENFKPDSTDLACAFAAFGFAFAVYLLSVIL
jgi:hypothetical protein